MQKGISIVLFVLLMKISFATPDLDNPYFGINAEIQTTIDDTQGNQIHLQKTLVTLSKDKVTLLKEQYGRDIQRDSDYLAVKYKVWGQVARGFTQVFKHYNDALIFIQEYPHDLVKRWNLPKQFDMVVDPHDQGKLMLKFSEPVYLNF